MSSATVRPSVRKVQFIVNLFIILEHPVGVEPTRNSFADCRVPVSPRMQTNWIKCSTTELHPPSVDSRSVQCAGGRVRDRRPPDPNLAGIRRVELRSYDRQSNVLPLNDIPINGVE